MTRAGETEDGSNSPCGEDRFYSGTIRKLFSGCQSGLVRSASGRELPFTFAHVVMIGPLRRFEDLAEGMPVGFDVGRTSKGLCVSVLQARPRSATETGSDPTSRGP